MILASLALVVVCSFKQKVIKLKCRLNCQISGLSKGLVTEMPYKQLYLMQCLQTKIVIYFLKICLKCLNFFQLLFFFTYE